jgi:hypothetical protein
MIFSLHSIGIGIPRLLFATLNLIVKTKTAHVSKKERSIEKKQTKTMQII